MVVGSSPLFCGLCQSGGRAQVGPLLRNQQYTRPSSTERMEVPGNLGQTKGKRTRISTNPDGFCVRNKKKFPERLPRAIWESIGSVLFVKWEEGGLGKTWVIKGGGGIKIENRYRCL